MSDSGLFYDIAAETTKKEAAAKYTTSETSKNSDLDKNAFLRLLMTQLQYQDPLNPMDNTEFVSQMAQFTSLEQMQNLNSTMTSSQAFSVIGRTVYAMSQNELGGYDETYGIVESVTIKSDGTPYLKIGDKEVKFSEVKNVYDSNTNTSIDRNLVVSQALGLIGKNVQAITMDEDLNAKEFIEGKVDYVKFVDDVPMLSINGKDVNTYEVLSVSDNLLLKGQTISANVYDKNVLNYVDVTGTVTGVKIDGDRINLIIDDDKYAEVENIGSVMNALNYVGKEIKSGDISGTVDSVIIRDKKPYLVVGDEEILASKLG